MTPWKAHLETIIRGDVGRSVHKGSWINTSGSRDGPGQAVVSKTRDIHGGDRPPPTCDDIVDLGIAARDSDGAPTRAVHQSGKVAVIVEAQPDGEAVIVMLAGEFDLAMADAVREVLARAISEPHKRLVVDLSKLTFIDSSGLHVILDTYTRCRDAEPTLTVRPGPPNVQRVFELTNLLNYLPFEISG